MNADTNLRSIEKVRQDEQMRLLVDSVTDYAIYLLDDQGHVVTWNSGAARLKGYTASEIVGKHFSVFYTPEDAARNHPSHVLNSARQYGRYEEEGWRVRKDGTRFLADIVVTPLRHDDGTVLGFAKVTRDITSRRQQERDQTISMLLQQALLPSVPTSVPGLSLDLFYKAAMHEAGVGGDFYDVFPCGPDQTVLVVGDLAGKGLAAAVEIGIVKNMLRFAMYNSDALGKAVASLNQTLVVNSLLKTFATLFVASYNNRSRVLTYINCGQEPALIRRASSYRIQQLVANSSIVGAFADMAYTEERVRLMPGDVLAIFTDGLTETGPTRDAICGLARIVEILSDVDAGQDVLTAIVDGIMEYAGNDIRDDMCLLTAQCHSAEERVHDAANGIARNGAPTSP